MSSLSMESIVRPFVKIESRPLNIVTPPPVTPPEEVPPAFIEWGAASNFIVPSSQIETPRIFVTDNDRAFITAGREINFIERETSIFDYAPEIELPEVSRQTRTVRVWNPEELELPEEQRTSFLDVEVIDRITFRSPDGGNWVFVLDNADLV